MSDEEPSYDSFYLPIRAVPRDPNVSFERQTKLLEGYLENGRYK